MGFNFKYALENTNDTSIQHKADEVLILTVAKLRAKYYSYSRIHSIYFSVIPTYYDRKYCHISVIFTSDSMQDIDLFVSDESYRLKEGLEIVQSIKDKLTDEGFECFDMTDGKILGVEKKIEVKF